MGEETMVWGRMKLTTTDLLLVVSVVLITLQINSCFTKVHKPEQMIRNEERIKYLEKERIEDSVIWVKIEAAIDSLLALSVIRYEQLENKKQPLTIRYEKIPVIVNDFDREQLRRAIADY